MKKLIYCLAFPGFIFSGLSLARDGANPPTPFFDPMRTKAENCQYLKKVQETLSCEQEGQELCPSPDKNGSSYTTPPLFSTLFQWGGSFMCAFECAVGQEICNETLNPDRGREGFYFSSNQPSGHKMAENMHSEHCYSSSSSNWKKPTDNWKKPTELHKAAMAGREMTETGPSSTSSSNWNADLEDALMAGRKVTEADWKKPTELEKAAMAGREMTETGYQELTELHKAAMAGREVTKAENRVEMRTDEEGNTYKTKIVISEDEDGTLCERYIEYLVVCDDENCEEFEVGSKEYYSYQKQLQWKKYRDSCFIATAEDCSRIAEERTQCLQDVAGTIEKHFCSSSINPLWIYRRWKGKEEENNSEEARRPSTSQPTNE